MNFSVVTDVLGTDSFGEALDRAQQLDFAYVDLRAKLDGSSIDTIDLKEAEERKRQIEERSLKVSCLTSWGINPIFLFGDAKPYDRYDEAFHTRMLAGLDRLCDLADLFDTSYIRIYSLTRPDGFDLLSADEKRVYYDHNASILRRHADLAGRRGKTILIENEPPSLTNCAEELGQLAGALQHPHLKINWDIVNEWIGGRYPTVESYERVKDYAVQVHLKGAMRAPDSEGESDPRGRFGRVGIAGQDDYDHAALLRHMLAYNSQLTLTIDTHYHALDERDQIGELEVVRRSKQFFESVL